MIPSTVVVPFLAFLMRHIHHLQHDTLVLIYDPATSTAADTIAVALHRFGTPVLALNISPVNPVRDDLHKSLRIRSSLTVVLIEPAHFWDNSFLLFRTHDKFVFVVGHDGIELIPADAQDKNTLYVLAGDTIDSLAFVVLQHPTMRLLRFANEAEFMASIYWQLFHGRVQRFPPQMRLTVSHQFVNLLTVYPVHDGSRQLLMGTDIGRFKVLAQCTGLYQIDHYFVVGDRHPVNMSTVQHQDARLIGETMREDVSPSQYAIQHIPSKTFISIKMVRYVVLAPRYATATSWTTFVQYILRRAVVVAGLLGITVGLAGTRWVFGSTSDTFCLNTFCRVLGISAPARGSEERSLAQRQLLVSISAIAILLSGVLGGALYGDLLMPEAPQRYRTVADLCRNNVDILVPKQVLLDPFRRVRNRRRGCYVPIDFVKQFNPNHVAVVSEEHHARAVGLLGTHHILAEPFCTRLVPMSFTHWFLEHPVQRTLRLCADHGIDHALFSAANHTVELRQARDRVAAEDPGVEAVRTGWEFGVVWLVLGWCAAGAVFACELGVAVCRQWWRCGRVLVGRWFPARGSVKKMVQKYVLRFD